MAAKNVALQHRRPVMIEDIKKKSDADEKPQAPARPLPPTPPCDFGIETPRSVHC